MDRVTADSNIYVSALKFGGKPLTLLDMALEGEIELAVSDSIIRETLDREVGGWLRKGNGQSRLVIGICS